MPAVDAEHGSEGYRRERHFARQCALQFLYQADLQGDWGNIARNLSYLRRQVRDLECLPGDIDLSRAWAYVSSLVQGVCEKRFAVDRLLGEAATNWTVARMSVVDRNILRLAAYEMCFAAHTPLVTAVDEGVELAKEFGHADSKRFVNGVLDRILRLRQEEGDRCTHEQGGADTPAVAPDDSVDSGRTERDREP